MPDVRHTNFRKGWNMKQREVQDKNNVRWVCVQAMSGVGKAAEDRLAEIKDNREKVEVVCTPSGGEQSVRITLPQGWDQALDDEDLIKAIDKVR